MAQQPADTKVIKWNMQTQWPASSASYKPIKHLFEVEFKQLTNGRLQTTVFPAGGIVPVSDIFKACSKGTVQAAAPNPAQAIGILPLSGMTGIPMNFRTAEEGLEFFFKVGLEDMLKEGFAKKNILYYTENIFPTALFGRKPITKLDDFKGYKFRSSGTMASFLAALGSATSVIPGGELYMALQTGVVDGAHWGGAVGGASIKLQEVTSYFIQPNLAWGTNSLIFNKDAFNALPKDIQQIIDKKLKERVDQQVKNYAAQELETIKMITKDGKVKISTIQPEESKKMQLVAVKFWDSLAAKDEDVAKAVAMLKGYLKKLGYID